MFEQNLILQMEARMIEVQRKLRGLWSAYVQAALKFPLLALVLAVEFELLYQTFSGIAGQDNRYWSPGLMATTGVIVVCAYHLLDGDRNGAMARLVRGITPVLIGLYLSGLGLLLAGVISLDSIPVLLSGVSDLVIGALPGDAPQKPWIEAFFQDAISPAGLAVFALGIGGLSIVNLFVASELLHGIAAHIHTIRDTKPEAARLQAEYETVQRCLTRYRELSQDLGDMTLWLDQRVMQETALQWSAAVQEALARHKRFIKRKEIAPTPGPFSPTDSIDPKLIEKEIRKIEAFDLNAILRVLNARAHPEV
jgi:hypothetical protein